MTPFYAAPHELTTRTGNEEATLVSVRKRRKTAVGVSFEARVDPPPRRLCSEAGRSDVRSSAAPLASSPRARKPEQTQIRAEHKPEPDQSRTEPDL
jgi:hypothetical protein